MKQTNETWGGEESLCTLDPIVKLFAHRQCHMDMACIEKRLYSTERKFLIPDLLNERKRLIFNSIMEFSNSSTFPNSIELNVEFREFFGISRNCRDRSCLALLARGPVSVTCV